MNEGKDPECPLCNLEDELTIYKDDKITICETKNRKGHRRRIMVVYNKHVRQVSEDIREYALKKLEEIGREVFSYTYKFVLLDSTYGSIPEHWHIVATDLDPNSDDFEQVLGTPWLKVIHVKNWK